MHASVYISMMAANGDTDQMRPYVAIMQVRTARELGAAVRAARREQGLTQAELAGRIGATRAWVGAFEGGKPTAELGLALRAIDALGLVADLVRAGPRHGGIDLDALLGDGDA